MLRGRVGDWGDVFMQRGDTMSDEKLLSARLDWHHKVSGAPADKELADAARALEAELEDVLTGITECHVTLDRERRGRHARTADARREGRREALQEALAIVHGCGNACSECGDAIQAILDKCT